MKHGRIRFLLVYKAQIVVALTWSWIWWDLHSCTWLWMGTTNSQLNCSETNIFVYISSSYKIYFKLSLQVRCVKVLLQPIVRCYEPSKQQLVQLVESLEKISSSKPCDQCTEVQPPLASVSNYNATWEVMFQFIYSNTMDL